MKLSQFNLNLLVALDALLRERNVTRAGQSVGVSQPAMSATLSRLRELFRDDLLVRVGRRLELTPLAHELTDPVRRCVMQIEDFIEHRRAFDPATEARTFVLAASDYASILLLPRLLERLAAEAPGVAVKFVGLNTQSAELLAAGLLDFVIMPSEVQPNLPGQLLFIDTWVCAAWSGHPDIGATLSEAEYLAQPHLAFAMLQGEARSIADHHLEQVGIRRRIVATADSFLLIPAILRGSCLLALIHQRLAERVKDWADIKLLPPPYDLPDIHESLFWNPRHMSSPPHLWLRSLLAEVARTL